MAAILLSKIEYFLSDFDRFPLPHPGFSLSFPDLLQTVLVRLVMFDSLVFLLVWSDFPSFIMLPKDAEAVILLLRQTHAQILSFGSSILQDEMLDIVKFGGDMQLTLARMLEEARPKTKQMNLFECASYGYTEKCPDDLRIFPR